MYIKSSQNIVKKQVAHLLLVVCLMAAELCFTQEQKASVRSDPGMDLFDSEEILPMKLAYSQREIRNNTNDSTYLKSTMEFQLEDGWTSMEVKLRARGHNRRKTCYFTPIKVKISKANRKGTIFKEHKKLKLVLPCLLQAEKNDKLLNEYLAYKLYENVADYYFRVKLLDIEYEEIRKNKSKRFAIKGFFIEDIDNVADRYGANVIKNRKVHPFEQDAHASAQNDIFQYMIGNTDYSSAYQHNAKLIFIQGKKAIPIPYDFDLSGLVNAGYAVVSKVGNQTLPITTVTERLYRGYERSPQVYKQVRQEYLAKKPQMLAEIERLRPLYESVKEYEMARDYIMEFYQILEDETKFRKRIIERARIK